MIDAATLRLRYPTFAATPDVTLAYWIADAGLTVTDAWGTDQEPATLSLAAHNMAVQGLDGSDPSMAGVTSFRSGAFSLTRSDASASATGYASTIYGREFLTFARRQFAGPRLVYGAAALTPGTPL